MREKWKFLKEETEGHGSEMKGNVKEIKHFPTRTKPLKLSDCRGYESHGGVKKCEMSEFTGTCPRKVGRSVSMPGITG